MSKQKLDEFLGKNEQSPLETDKIYGGNAEALDTIKTTKKRVEEVVVTVTD